MATKHRGSITRRVGRMCSVGLLAASAALGAHAAANYPVRPIRLIVPFAPGGSTDVLARSIAAPLGDVLGQQVVVDNRPAAGGNIGAEVTARAPADGYTLLMGSSGTLAINPSLYPRLNYHPVRDFAPIVHVGSSPHLMAVNPALPFVKSRKIKALAVTSAKRRSGPRSSRSPARVPTDRRAHCRRSQPAITASPSITVRYSTRACFESTSER